MEGAPGRGREPAPWGEPCSPGDGHRAGRDGCALPEKQCARGAICDTRGGWSGKRRAAGSAGPGERPGPGAGPAQRVRCGAPREGSAAAVTALARAFAAPMEKLKSAAQTGAVSAAVGAMDANRWQSVQVRFWA